MGNITLGRLALYELERLGLDRKFFLHKLIKSMFTPVVSINQGYLIKNIFNIRVKIMLVYGYNLIWEQYESVVTLPLFWRKILLYIIGGVFMEKINIDQFPASGEPLGGILSHW